MEAAPGLALLDWAAPFDKRKSFWNLAALVEAEGQVVVDAFVAELRFKESFAWIVFVSGGSGPGRSTRARRPAFEGKTRVLRVACYLTMSKTTLTVASTRKRPVAMSAVTTAPSGTVSAAFFQEYAPLQP